MYIALKFKFSNYITERNDDIYISFHVDPILSISQGNKAAKKSLLQQGRNENIFKSEDKDSRSTYFSKKLKNIVLSLENDRWINLRRLSAFSRSSSFLLFMKIALPLFSHRSLYCVQ